MSEGEGKTSSEQILGEDEVTTIVRNKLGRGDGRLVSYTVKPATDDLMGFLGEHYRAVANVAVSGEVRRFSFFVKKIPEKVPEHKEYALKTRAFYKEIELYKTLFADLKNSQMTGGEFTKWHPEYYYSRGTDLFVLEDLAELDYYMYPERIPMDEEHLLASVRAMAAMHAASVVFEERFNRGEVKTLSPNTDVVPGKGKKVLVGEVYSHLTFETEASDEVGHPGNAFTEAGIKAQVNLVKYLDGYSDEEKRVIAEKLPDHLRHYLQLVKPSKKFKNVFIHGDLWSNNLLFRKDESGKVKDSLIIDFQLARYAPPAHDLMMFLYLVQDRAFIEKKYNDVTKYYYDEFCRRLSANSLDGPTLFPWGEFLDSCEFYRDLGRLCKVLYFQLCLAPTHITNAFQSTPEAFTQNMLVDRSDMVRESFLNDDLCRQRMQEAMDEVVKKYILTSREK